MKRLWMLICCMALAWVLACPVDAAQEALYEDAGELYEAWMASGGVPDYISGVWSSDGGTDNLTFGIVLGQEAQAQALPGLLQNPGSLTLVYQTYSWNQLRQLQREMEVYLQQELGFVSVGVSVYDNQVVAEVHTDYLEDPQTQQLVEELQTRYGDMLEIAYVDAYPQLTISQEPQGWTRWLPRQTQSFGVLILLTCVAAALLVNGYILRKQQYRLWNLQGRGGQAGGFYSRKALESVLRESYLECPASLDQRLQETISHI